MKEQIKKEDIDKFKRDSNIFTILFILTIHCFVYWKGIYIRDEFELQNVVIELNNSFIELLKENEILSIVRSVGKAIDKFLEYE